MSSINNQNIQMVPDNSRNPNESTTTHPENTTTENVQLARKRARDDHLNVDATPKRHLGVVVHIKPETPMHIDAIAARTGVVPSTNIDTRDAQGNTPLMLAATLGDTKTVQELIKLGATINATNTDGKTALMLATVRESAETMLALTRFGAKVDVRDAGGNTALMLAAASGNTETVQVLIQARANLDLADRKGRTALMLAAIWGPTENVLRLISTNDNLAAKDQDGNTALMLATMAEHAESVRALAGAGTNLNVKDKDGNTALMLAAMEGYTGIVQALTKADTDLKNKDGKTALMFAAAAGHTETVQALIMANANLKLKDKDAKTALMLAATEGRTETVHKLALAGAKIDAEDTDCNTALMLAATAGHTKTVQKLAFLSAKIDATNAKGETALILAAREEHVETVEALAEKGADLNVTDADGNTALIIAAAAGHAEIVEALVQQDADLNVTDADGNTALIIAAAAGHAEIVKALAEKDANLNLTDADGNTALIIAAAAGHAEIVEALVQQDADLNVTDADGNTALMLAAAAGHAEIVEALVQKDADLNVKNADGNTALMLAVRKGYAKTVKALIKESADLNITDADGNTALMLAATAGHAETVKALAKKGADLTITDADGNTALILAAIEGHAATVEALAKKGADIHVKDVYGNTALMFAAIMGRTETVHTLAEKGADLNLTDADGNTALMLATTAGHTETVRSLIKLGAQWKMNAYTIEDNVLCVTIPSSTTIPFANEHLALFAQTLRSYHQTHPNGLSTLQLKVNYIDERGSDASGLSKRFIKEILESPIILARNQDENMELFKALTGKTNNGLYRILCNTRTDYDENNEPTRQVNIPLSAKQTQICQNMGTVLSALCMGFGKQFDLYHDHEIQKYVIGQLFPPEFYAGLLMAWTYKKTPSTSGEVKEMPSDMDPDGMDALILCSFIANSDPENLGYGLFDAGKIDFTDRHCFSNLSDDQVHQFYQLLFRGLDLEELLNTNKSLHQTISLVHETFMNSASTSVDISRAIEQFRSAMAVDQAFYAFTLQSLKSTLYEFYGNMIPPLLAMAKGSLKGSIDADEHRSFVDYLNNSPATRDSNQARGMVTALSTYIQGKPFTRENFIKLITESIKNADPRIKPQCTWLLEWFDTSPEEDGATDEQMKQFLNTVTGIPVITAHLEEGRITFDVASTSGIFIHTCFNKIDISPDLTKETLIPSILSPNIVEETNVL